MNNIRGKTQWHRRPWLLAFFAGVTIISASAFLRHAVIAESFHSPLLPSDAGEFAAPITSGGTAETKAGSLIEGGNLTVSNPRTLFVGGAGGASQFCLNPANRSSTTYCIKSWTEIQPSPHLQLFSGSTDTLTNVQSNLFARVQAGQDQQFALQGHSGDPDPAHLRTRAGVVGTAANFGDPNFVGVFGQVPGATGAPGELAQAALFDGNGIGTGPAGQVAVRVSDADGLSDTTNDRRFTVGTSAVPQGICLYGDGQTDGTCVTQWSNEVVKYRDPSSGYFLLQSRAFSPDGTLDAQKPPITSQLGMVRVPGHASFTSIVVGTPGSQSVWGDGICSASPNENSPYPVDCPGISGLAVSNVTASSANITWQTTPETTTSVSYGRSGIVFDQQGSTSTALTFGHAITLSGLSPASTYYVRVVGVTASGAALSSIMSFPTAS